MKTQKPKKNDNFAAYLLGLFFLASSALFGVFVISDDHGTVAGQTEGQSDFSSTRNITELDKVNDHLKSVADKMEYERLKTLVANLKASRDTGPSTPIVQNNDDQPIVELENDLREKQMAQQLGRTNEIKRPATDPRSLVYNSVIEDRQLAKAKEEERIRQAKEFVAKARKEGWIVNLDSDFKIKSYRHVDDMPDQNPEKDYRGFPVVPK
tara:strand:+ start:125936 stop:126565 length:630 start_codon:yes stop_codon:yes gene_type:complete